MGWDGLLFGNRKVLALQDGRETKSFLPLIFRAPSRGLVGYGGPPGKVGKGLLPTLSPDPKHPGDLHGRHRQLFNGLS